MTDRPFLPYGRQLIDEADIAAVVAVLKSDWLTTGPAVAAFETALAERVGARHAVACSNGTAALHLALLALEVDKDAWIAVPANTFLATANAARLAGAEVLFVDVDPETGLMTPETLLSALKRNNLPIVGVMPVHFAGQCVDLPRLRDIASERGLFVVEDAAHALGARYEDGDGGGHAIGSCRHSEATAFSFHPVKTITMGEGGAVTTNDARVHERLKAARSHGMIADPARIEDADAGLDEAGRLNPWYYEMPSVGYNYRATDMQCALGLSQLGKLDRFIARRTSLAAHYDMRLAGLSPFVRRLGRAFGCVPAWHLYVTLIDFDKAGASRADAIRQLRERGIGAQVHYRPVAAQPYYVKRYGRVETPGADAYYRRALSLPLHPGMEIGDVDRVVDALEDILGVAASAKRQAAGGRP